MAEFPSVILAMGRSYMFECPRCYYRAIVAGGLDSSFHCWVQTIVCYDCKALHDVPVRVRVRIEEPHGTSAASQTRSSILMPRTEVPEVSNLLNRLFVTLAKEFRWVNYKLRCPKSDTHRIEPWREPGKCPRCNTQLERSLTPYRIWD
ncbi:MAG: hypothetical protein NZ739_07425 [Verrucomicrobiae bacterium]|nr:hypothetical protein [Verrucomicrobiae bacterium]MCX7723352.1 hypothetical protein [Verrucomicrobiae bacterium]MDW7979075.1 hypothetical protein [Verrucomicrobiales bacterium]